jgi:hypothetical protein
LVLGDLTHDFSVLEVDLLPLAPLLQEELVPPPLLPLLVRMLPLLPPPPLVDWDGTVVTTTTGTQGNTMAISPVNTIISQDTITLTQANITLSQGTTITVESLTLPTDGTLEVDLLPLAPLLEE